MTPLRQRFLDELRRRNYSPRTAQAYLAGVVRFAKHFGRSPDLLGTEDLREFQLHLIDKGTSWSQFNQIVCALRFLYNHVLHQPDMVPFIPFGKKPRSLPVVLSPDEVQRLFDAVELPRDLLLLRLAYGCGLRLSELLHLRVADIDGSRLLLWVRHGKGAKDRCVPLSRGLLQELRQHWHRHRPKEWLFANPQGKPLGPWSLQRRFGRFRTKAGLTKPATMHTLRHSYATHLLEAGTSILTLQRLLGHSQISSTMRYLHLRSEVLGSVRSPLELLESPLEESADGHAVVGSGSDRSSA